MPLTADQLLYGSITALCVLLFVFSAGYGLKKFLSADSSRGIDEYRWAIGSLIVTTIIAFFIAGVKFLQNTPGIDIATTVLLTIYSSGILSICLRLWIRIDKLDTKLSVAQQSINNEILTTRQTIEQKTLLTSFTSKLLPRHEIFKNVGFATLTSQMLDLRSDDNSFTIRGTDWAMRSNSNFWREVTRYVRNLESRPSTPPIVKVIHSGDPRLWFTKEALGSLYSQQAFTSTEVGGKIERIIVGEKTIDQITSCLRDNDTLLMCSEYNLNEIVSYTCKKSSEKMKSSSPEDEDYCLALKLMQLHGIDAYYVEGKRRGEFDRDFAMFTIGDGDDANRLVMEWEHDHELWRVDRCRFIDMAEPGFDDQWRAFWYRATNFSDMTLQACRKSERCSSLCKLIEQACPFDKEEMARQARQAE